MNPNKAPKKKTAGESHSFWISYSDLSTGLMIVFMLIMLIMVMIQKKATENQTERISDITAKLEIILGEKSKLSDSINLAFKDDPSVKADPVTAQISIDEDALRFTENQSTLEDGSIQFLYNFTPKYICSLWLHEYEKCTERKDAQSCDRIDPSKPGGVRLIHVTGHADMKGLYANNHLLSSNRAEEVVQTMLRSLQESSGVLTTISQTCQDNINELHTYAQERLWAVGAGETEHCTKELNENDKINTTPFKGCDALLESDSSYRKVDFRLELTGDDMTGLLADIVALREEVGYATEEADRIDILADTVANNCWNKPRSYHGCVVFTKDCLSGHTSTNCQAMFENRKKNLEVWNMIKKICSDENLPLCPQNTREALEK